MEERYWDSFKSWEEAEEKWDKEALDAAEKKPIQGLKVLPKIPGIEERTRHRLKWKSFKWMLKKDEGFRITRFILKHPIRYAYRYLKSLFMGKSYVREDDFFLYGISSLDELYAEMAQENTIFVVGFSYCEKPHECPSGRFTPKCVRDLSNPICRQCFIGKSIHTLPKENTVPLLIPTIHYIGEKIFETIEQYAGKNIIFLITACEMTLEMFGDWGNMAGIKGVGVRLDGRICNTMRAFELSEEGIKPGLTVLRPATEKQVLKLLATWRALKG